MKLKKTATALVVALVPLLALAVSDARADYDARQLAKVKAVEVLITDKVIDGCLPRPSILKTEAELVLRRSGIEVEAGLASHLLTISVVGFELTRGSGGTPVGACVGHFELLVLKFEKLLDRSISMVLAGTDGAMLAGPKDVFQNQLRNAVNEKVTELANEILKARANASSKSQ